MSEAREEFVKEHLQRFSRLETRRQLWEDIWQSISDYILPRLTNLKSTTKPQPERYGLKAYNGASINALRLAVDGTAGYLMPPSGRWFSMQPVQRGVLDYPGVRKFYQETDEAMHAALHRSNFYDEMIPILEHGFAPGTAGTFVDDDGMRAQLVPYDPRDLYIAENKYSLVDTFYSRKWMTGRQILERFDQEAIDKATKDQMQREPFERWEVVHCHYPRASYDFDRVDAKNMPWASVWILKEKQVLLRESGFEFQRSVCWRYRKRTGEEYGTSPGWDALVDVIRLNQASKTLIDAAHMAVRPPVTYPAEMREMIEIQPNGMTPYLDPNRKAEIMNVLGSYPIGRDREQALEQAIRDHYQTDFFLILSQSERQRTAFEVSEILGEKAAVMGTKIGRIESELLDPLLETIYNIEFRAGRMPQAPDSVLELAPEYRFEYTGPLAQLQKRHYGRQARNQALAELAPIAQLFPDALDYVNGDEWIKNALHEAGVDMDMVREEQDVERIRSARQRMQAQAQMAQQLEQVMGAAQKGGKAPEAGSPTAEMAEGMKAGGLIGQG